MQEDAASRVVEVVSSALRVAVVADERLLKYIGEMCSVGFSDRAIHSCGSSE